MLDVGIRIIVLRWKSGQFWLDGMAEYVMVNQVIPPFENAKLVNITPMTMGYR